MTTKKVNELNAFASDPVNVDLVPVWDTDAGALKYATVAQLQTAITGTVVIPVFATMFVEENGRNLNEQWLGNLQAEATAETLANGDDITFNMGQGRVMVVPIAGTDVAGTITVTGTTVSRTTGAQTIGDSETITVDALATDSTSTTSQGNTLFGFSGAYITSKLFIGAVTISTTDVNLSDVDVYQVGFEQFDQDGDFTVKSFSMSLEALNTSAFMEAFLYSVDVTGSKVTIQDEATLRVDSADILEADEFFRLRVGGIDKTLYGSTDGIFVMYHLGPDNQTYWADITGVIDATVPVQIT